MKNKTIFILAALFLTPLSAIAASHTYTYAELTNPTCIGGGGSPAVTQGSGQSFVFTGGTGSVSDWCDPAFDTRPAGTYYLHYTYSGTGTGKTATNGDTDLGGPEVDLDSSGTAIITSNGTTNSVTQGISIRANASLNATIDELCIDDDNATCNAGPPPPPPPPSGFLAALAAATSTFSGTTGIDIDAVVVWSGDNLVKLFIGSGLALLYLLRGWIVALLIISAIVLFAYRAFRFFRH